MAKLISDTAKPFGARAILDCEAEEEQLARNPVTEVSGIAGGRERRFWPLGIKACLDMARADRRLSRRLLTASGEALWWELNGEAVLPIRPQRIPHKVLSRRGSFGEATDDLSVLWGWLVRNLERLIEELQYHNVLTERNAVWISYWDGQAGGYISRWSCGTTSLTSCWRHSTNASARPGCRARPRTGCISSPRS